MPFVQYEEVEIQVEQLKPGMYVTSLDRPWLDTPFLMQGFTIETEKQIKQLAKYCEYVKIDKKTLNAYHPQAQSFCLEPLSAKPKSIPARTQQPQLHQELPKARKGRHQDSQTLKDELPLAQSAQQCVANNLKEVYSDISAGKQVDMVALNNSVKSMVNSITRNPDAMIWLTLLKRTGGYDYHHALGCSVWSVALGRQLGLSHNELNLLAMGSMMCDIGKAHIDKNILNKAGQLTDSEFAIVQKHVTFSISMLSKNASPPKEILAIVAYHHERYDGSGYPRQLKAEHIPVFARIAGLADCYDALTRPRSYAQACSPADAIRQLYGWRDRFFQAELIEEFIQSIGLYPAGSVVKLTDNSIAVVVAEGRRQRLHPKVMLLLDPQGNSLPRPEVINLAEKASDSVHIQTGVSPEEYGIDLDELYL